MINNRTKKISFYLTLIIIISLLTPSCSGTKFLKEGQQLYLGSEIKFDPANKVKNDKEIKTDLNKKLVPKPNKKFLGLFQFRVWAYLKLEPKKNKGFKYWLRNKIGKPPILIEDIEIEQKEKILAKAMQDNGYFNTKVSTEVKARIRNEKAVIVHYTIKNTGPTYIDTFLLPEKEAYFLDSLITNFPDYEVKSNQIYSLKNIQKDRSSLAYHIRSHGYYDFNKNDLIYLVDTSDYKHFDMRLIVKEPADSTSTHQKYHIRNVEIYPSYIEDNTIIWDSLPLKDAKSKTLFPRYTSQYPTEGSRNEMKLEKKLENPETKFFKIKEHYRFITRKVLSENVFIEPDDLFSIDDYKLTTSRLVNLGLYKFVNIDYKKLSDDSLDVTIKLSPTQHQRFKTSVELSSSTLGYLGSNFNISYNNKNTSKKAIDLTFKVGAGTDFQFSNRKAELNVLDVNMGLSFSVPRRLRFKEEKLKTASPPTTSFKINESFQKWIQYYTINDLNLEFTYNWQRKIKLNKPTISHELTPVNFSWLYLINTTTDFDNLLVSSDQLKSSFENNFIIGSKYNLTVNTKKDIDQRNFFLLQHNLESSGNLAYLFGKAFKPKQVDDFEILGTPFSQFLHLEIDYRNYWTINAKTKLITRLNSGIGLTYGNRESLPYSRQFFMGGPNTVRAFSIRNIGPGRYTSDDADENAVEQTGDIKLLMNVEYRWTFYKFIRGATFIDAGNVWLLRDDPERPDGNFGSDFISQLALGTGLGLRLDFNFVAIRLDLGIPIYKPYEEEGNRWITNSKEDSFKEWRKKNWTWNFAIGYPF